MSVKLSKAQRIPINLSKAANGTIEKLFFGARWGKIGGGTKTVKKGGIFGFGAKKVEVNTPGKSVDLDASVFYLDADGTVLDICYYGCRTIDGAYHSGDDLVGGVGESDNETITISTEKVPANVKSVVLTLNSYSGDELDDVPFAGMRIYEGAVNSPTKTHCEFLMENDASFDGKYSVVVGKLYREGNGWGFEAIGDTYKHKRIDPLKKELAKYK